MCFKRTAPSFTYFRPSQSSPYNLLKQESTRWRSQPCYCCGNTGHRAKDIRCPANGKTCRSCSKVGHFATVCRSRPKPANYTSPPQNQALQVSEHNNVTSYSDDDECIFCVQQFPNLPTTPLGATVNIVDRDTYYSYVHLKMLICPRKKNYALEHSIDYIRFKNSIEHFGDNNCHC